MNEIQKPYYGITPSGIKCRTCGSLTTVIDGDVASSNEHNPDCPLGKQEAQFRADYGRRGCSHKNAIISELEDGGWKMDCADCDTLACADGATAWGLGWVKPA